LALPVFPLLVLCVCVCSQWKWHFHKVVKVDEKELLFLPIKYYLITFWLFWFIWNLGSLLTTCWVCFGTPKFLNNHLKFCFVKTWFENYYLQQQQKKLNYHFKMTSKWPCKHNTLTVKTTYQAFTYLLYLNMFCNCCQPKAFK
jgi:hypothetical protein